MARKRPLGNHEYVQLSFALINEGDLIRQIDEAMADAYKRMEAWEFAGPKDGGTRKGKFALTVEVLFERSGDNHLSTSAKIKTKTPPIVIKNSLVRAIGGRLLCEEDGTYDPDDRQLTMFNGRGEPIRVIDKETGEELAAEPTLTVGKVAAAGG